MQSSLRAHGWVLVRGYGAPRLLLAQVLGKKTLKDALQQAPPSDKTESQEVRLSHKLFIFLHHPTSVFCSGEGKTRLSDKVIMKRSEIKVHINFYVKQSCRGKPSALQDFWENLKMSLVHLCNWDNYVSQWEENEKSLYYYTALSIRKRWLVFNEKKQNYQKTTYLFHRYYDMHSYRGHTRTSPKSGPIVQEGRTEKWGM